MTIPHLAMEEFLQAAAIEIKDIPFRGGPQTIAELLRGVSAPTTGTLVVENQDV